MKLILLIVIVNLFFKNTYAVQKVFCAQYEKTLCTFNYNLTPISLLRVNSKNNLSNKNINFKKLEKSRNNTIIIAQKEKKGFFKNFENKNNKSLAPNRIIKNTKSSDDTLTTMSNKRICVEATQRGQVKKWETNPKFLKFVDEAKLRNLDCNVVTETIVNFPDLRQVPLVRKFDIDSYLLDDLPGYPYDGYLSGPKFDKSRKKFVYVDLYFNFNKDGKLEYNSILIVDTNDQTQEHFIKLSISYLILFESSLFEDVNRINRNTPENLSGIVRFVSEERSKDKFYLGENFENLIAHEKKQFDFGVKFTDARFPIIMLAFYPYKNYKLNKENNSILLKIEKLNYLVKNDVNKIPQKLEKKIKFKYLKLDDQILNKITNLHKDIKSSNLDVKELSNLNLIRELKKENIKLAQDIKINKSKYEALNNKITDIRKLKLYKKEEKRLSDLSSDYKRKYVVKVARCYDKIPNSPLKGSLGGRMMYIDSVRNNVNEAFLAAEQLSQAIKFTFNYKIVCP